MRQPLDVLVPSRQTRGCHARARPYLWNAGYWGPEVGFYGGINYGFGYVGTGYFGGRWTDGHFFYNTHVNNVNVHVVRNVYQKTVVVHNSHVSYNGGHGGINARPTAAQESFAHEHHTAPTEAQERHVTEARADRSQFASVNHGRPSVVATARPGEFKGAGVVQAKASSSDRIGSSRTETKSEAKPRGETPARTETKSVATRESKSESKPAAAREPKTEAKPKAEPKPAATHDSKPEARPASQSKPAARPKAEPQHESAPKPAATHESKPPAQHESAPAHEEKPKKN